jgi:hypothetical protein
MQESLIPVVEVLEVDFDGMHGLQGPFVPFLPVILGMERQLPDYMQQNQQEKEPFT